MTSDTTMILNLTFVGTLMIAALLAALVLFAGCMALVFTGLGRLVYLGATRLIGAGRTLGGRVVAARQTSGHQTSHDDADAPAPAAVTSSAARDSSERVPAPSSSTAAAASGTTTANGKSGLIPSWRKPAGPAAEPAVDAASTEKAAPSVTVKLSEPETPPAERAGLRAEADPEQTQATRTEPALAVTPVVTPAGGPRPAKKAAPKSSGRSAPRPTDSARNTVPGILRPSQDPEEQHAKGA